MRAIKLIVIFLLLVGGIFLALNWELLFSVEAKNPDGFAEDDVVDTTDMCDEIRDAWTKQAGWNDQLYQSQRADIDQKRAMNMFSKEGYNTVNNCLRETAANKACDSYATAIKDSVFRDSKLQICYKGVEAIKVAEKLDADPRILRVDQLHHLYTNISRFVRSRHEITPLLEAETGDWKSFSELQSAIIFQAKRYRENSLFKELSHIPGFKDGLDGDALKQQTERQRKDFYLRLSQQIVSYFKSEEPTEKNVSLLNSVWQKFIGEEPNSDNRIKEFAELVVRYGK